MANSHQIYLSPPISRLHPPTSPSLFAAFRFPMSSLFSSSYTFSTSSRSLSPSPPLPLTAITLPLLDIPLCLPALRKSEGIQMTGAQCAVPQHLMISKAEWCNCYRWDRSINLLRYLAQEENQDECVFSKCCTNREEQRKGFLTQ